MAHIKQLYIESAAAVPGFVLKDCVVPSIFYPVWSCLCSRTVITQQSLQKLQDTEIFRGFFLPKIDNFIWQRVSEGAEEDPWQTGLENKTRMKILGAV